MKILCFGSLNIDHTYQVEHFVRPGETSAAVSYQLHAGGKGLNQAIALSKAGAHTYMAGCVGEDGQELMKTLKAAGIDTSFVNVIQEPTGHAVIQVNPSGQNCILIFHGANYGITYPQIEETLAHFEKGDVLLLQNEINLIDHIARRAKAAGMEVWLNSSPITPELLSGEAVGLADGIVLNEIELSALTGADTQETGVRIFREKYPNQKIVLTLGERGAVYLSQDTVVKQTAFPVTAIDTTGAGDTFLGYFLAGYLSTHSPENAMEYAAKASSLAVTRIGAAEAIPDAEEVRNLTIQALSETGQNEEEI